MSVEYLHWASGQHGSGRQTLSGASAALAVNGQPPEVQWPYDTARKDNVPSYSPPASATGPFRTTTVDKSLNDVPAVVTELSSGRCAVLVIGVTDRFLRAAGGLVTDDGSGTEAHAVVAVGAATYAGQLKVPGVAPQATLLCIRNSWGSGWGVDGHALMTADAIDNCLIAAVTIAPT